MDEQVAAAVAPAEAQKDELERLRQRLADDRGHWRRIAEDAEVSYHTLIRFANGDVKRPWGRFVARIRDFYRDVDTAS